MPQGMLFNIQRFSIHDGPGIRTTVFFKGCNLRCFWCHNPESLSAHPELQFFVRKCIGCGACFKSCPNGVHTMADGEHLIDREKCTRCGICAAHCPNEALVIAGKLWSVEDVLAEVMKDQPFYETSKGGMTLSGGEALLQAEFAAALLKAAKAKGLHNALDTAGLVPWSTYEAVLPDVDLFLFDIKALDPAMHKRGTRADNALILDNLKRLHDTGATIWVRIPVIPGYNDNADTIAGIADFLKSLTRLQKVELLPFHRLGGGKYTSLGLPYEAEPLQTPSAETMQALLSILLERGLPAVTD